MVNRYQKHDVAHTFAFSERDFFCRSLFTCLFSLLRVKTFDADDVNNKVEQVCKFQDLINTLKPVLICYKLIIVLSNTNQIKLYLLVVLDVLNFSFVIF